MIMLPNGNPDGGYGYHQWDALEVGDAIIVKPSYASRAASHLNQTRPNKRFEVCKCDGVRKVVRIE